jgi:hypothetical protein
MLLCGLGWFEPNQRIEFVTAGVSDGHDNPLIGLDDAGLFIPSDNVRFRTECF